jgi:hypothetical protein
MITHESELNARSVHVGHQEHLFHGLLQVELKEKLWQAQQHVLKSHHQLQIGT